MINRNLKAKTISKRFRSYSAEEQKNMLDNYAVIIRDFHRKPPDEVNDYNEYKNCFKHIKSVDRVMYFHGVLLQLTAKEHFWIRVLLRESEIDEKDFNLVTFRKNKCKNRHRKQNGDIKKSVADFKRRLWKQVKSSCEENECYFNKSENIKNLYEESFNQLICYKRNYGCNYRLETCYIVK